MTGKTEAWLARLSDPAGLNPKWSPSAFLPREVPLMRGLLGVAARHNIRPALVANLGILARDDPAALMSAPPQEAAKELEALMEDARQQRLQDVGNALLLANVAGQILSKAGELPVVLVKGADFAEQAYGGLQARTFSDVDLLVRPDAEEALNVILRELGFAPVASAKARPDYTERQWVKPDAFGRTMLVEVHTDMVHRAELRSRQTLTYDLHAGPAVGGVTPAARLVLAALHGATSHLFGRLQYVVDGLMIGRMGVDPDELRERADRSGARLASATMLRLACSLYEFEEGEELLRALGPLPYARLERRLITVHGVLGGKSRHRWRLLPQRYIYRGLMRIGTGEGGGK